MLVGAGLDTGVCEGGLNLLKIPLSSGGFVLFGLSLTFLRLKGKRDSGSEGARDESSAAFHSQGFHS